MRQEPGVYVNGQPMCARPPNKESDLTAIICLLLADYLVWKIAQFILFFLSVRGRSLAPKGKTAIITPKFNATEQK